MLRRKWLELVLGTSTVLIVARDWLVSDAAAQGDTATKVPTPTTVSEAIKAHQAASVAAFIHTYPTRATAATIQEKGTMLYLIGVCPLAAQNWDRMTLASQSEYERAALTILRGIDRNAAAMAEVVRIVGGPQVIETKLPRLTNSELKTVLQTMVKP